MQEDGSTGAEETDGIEKDAFGVNRRPLLGIGAGAVAAGALGTSALGSASGNEETSSRECECNGDDDTDDTDDSDLPTLHIVGTGGTIANPSDRDGYYSPDELVEERPGLADIASVEVTGVSQVPSQDITTDVLFDTYNAITDEATSDDPPDGFVVTTGSNGNAEVAYFLNLALDTDIPVVLTAAQRAIGTPGTESDANLYGAATTAVSEDAYGRGVLQVANDEIQHARDVVKAVASRPDGWQSPNFGRVGIVSGGEAHFYSSRDRLSTTDTEFDLTDVDPVEFPLSMIDVTYSGLMTDGTIIDKAIECGAKGIVAAVYPTQSAADPETIYSQDEALSEAVDAGIPVVIANNGWEGRFSGRGSFIGGDTLQPEKARLLLAFGLLESSDFDYLQGLFEKY